MARRRVYINPFNQGGTAYSGWIDVTNDVDRSSLNNISMKLDCSDYNTGVFTNSGVNLVLRNASGKYSDVGSPYSIFQFQRGLSLVKITYDESDFDFQPGIANADDIQGQEILVYQGFLNDDSTLMQLKSAFIEFQLLGIEHAFDLAVSPFSLDNVPTQNDFFKFGDPTQGIDAATLIALIISYANSQLPVPILNFSSAVTFPYENDFCIRLPVADLTFIPGHNIYPNIYWDAPTAASGNQNNSCKDVLNIILTACNAVLFMDPFDFVTPIVAQRVPFGPPGGPVETAYNFNGPGSTRGPENIVDIQDIRSGLNRTFNFITFSNNTQTVLVRSQFQIPTSTDPNSFNSQSIKAYGTRFKTLSCQGITNSGKQKQICQGILAEFAFPKQELVLVTTLSYAVLQIGLLEQISIDYPLVPIQNAPLTLPVYGKAVYGQDSYPFSLNQFSIEPTDYYKVLGIEIDFTNNLARFTLREI